ncbi:MAG: hypothetical protein HY253_12935 [Burkholderiales bacterium]|nr:hypothetical protein [Burkholderiales bacterium]
MTAWISNSCPAVVHYATGQHKELLELFGQTVVTRQHGMKDPFDPDEYEQPFISPLLLRAKRLGMEIREFKRPEFEISPAAVQFADQQANDKTIMLFPLASRLERIWSMAYWIDLSELLLNAGFQVMTCLPSDRSLGEDFRGKKMIGMGWHFLAALMLRSRMVVCGCTGPAHVAGNLNVPCLCLSGPTARGAIYDHVPSVRQISGQIGCEGCFFQAAQGFRPACFHGCRSLNSLMPETVYDRILQNLA